MFGKSEKEIEKMRAECLEWLGYGDIAEFAKMKNVTRSRISHILKARTNGKRSLSWLMEMHRRAMKNKKQIQKPA